MKKERYDVVLVQPNITWVYDPIEHLGLAYLAAALRKDGFRVRIVDAVLDRLSPSALYKVCDEFEIGVLGLTLISHGYPTTVRFLEMYRKYHPETRVVAGGHFATFAYDKIFEHTDVFDAIFLGEAELSLVRYCRHWLRRQEQPMEDIALPSGELTRSGARAYDMDELAFPERDYLQRAMALGATPSVTASRGCYARCSFCTVHNFYGMAKGPRWLSRSIDDILAELTQLHERFAIEHFLFVDDNFMGPGLRGRERAIAFAQAYRSSGLPMTFHIDCRAVDVYDEVIAALCEAGLTSIFIGIESISQQDLKLYRKDLKAEANLRAVEICRAHDLDVTLSMIMFNPDTRAKQILENVAFLREASYFPRNPLSILNVYEGTDLRRHYEGLLSGPFWDYHFEFRNDQTKIIHRETLEFCKQTLPLERKLSVSGAGLMNLRTELYRLRLSFLEDMARNVGREPLDVVRARWRPRLQALARVVEQHAPTGEPGPGAREYMTGSGLDAEPQLPKISKEMELIADWSR